MLPIVGWVEARGHSHANVYHIHTTGPYFPPSRPHFGTQLWMVIVKVHLGLTDLVRRSLHNISSIIPSVPLTGDDAKHTMTAFTELLITPKSTLETTTPTIAPALKG